MNLYLARFRGRTAGAIGIFYPIETAVEAETEKEAKEKLYELFEHIEGLTFFNGYKYPYGLPQRCPKCGNFYLKDKTPKELISKTQGKMYFCPKGCQL